MKKVFLFPIIITAFIIAGCNDKTSVDWYVNHHDDLIEKYTECLLAKSWHDPICQNARSAKNLEIDKPDVKKGVENARQKVVERSLAQAAEGLN